MKDFWQQQAILYGNDLKAVNFDTLEEKLEFCQLEKLVAEFNFIGDIGCGNGRATLHLAEMFPQKKFIGIDFIPEMIQSANDEKTKHNLSNVDFFVGNLGEGNLNKQFNLSFDFIFTKRLLINLKGNLKNIGVENINSMLKKNGTYAMIECFTEPLEKINRLRKHLKLPAIEVRFFNEYLTEEFINYVKVKMTLMEIIDFESFYYFISRIYNAALTEGTPDYLAPINLLTVDLMEHNMAPLVKGYAPEKIYVFKK